MNKKNPLKTVSILLSIILVLCTFTSIVSYAKVNKSDDYIDVMIDHTPRFPVLGEEVTFFVHLTSVDGSEINCKFYEDGVSANPDKEVDYNVEGREIKFTLNWAYSELGEKHPRFVVTDNLGGEGSNGEKICVAELYDKQINIDPIEQEPRVPILFSTDKLTYDGCRWIFDDSKISDAVVKDDYWYHPIELGISGLVEEGEYNGRFVEVDHTENGDNFYVKKFSYEIRNLKTLQNDYDETLTNLNLDKDKDDDFNSESRSFIALYNEIKNIDISDNKDILHKLLDDVSGNNLADKIDDLIDPSISDKRQTYIDLNNIMKDAKSDIDETLLVNVFNYLKDNKIKSIDDLEFDDNSLPIPDWASDEEEVKTKIDEIKDEVVDHISSNGELKPIYKYISEGLEIDIITVAIWFATIFLLCIVITTMVPEVALILSAIDGIVISILFLVLIDNAGFIEGINSFIKSREIVIAYGLNELEYSALISVIALVFIGLPILGIFCSNAVLSSIIASTTITALAASAYVIVPIIKDKLNFDDDSSSPAPVPVPIAERPILSFIFNWFFDRNPDAFPLLRRIFEL